MKRIIAVLCVVVFLCVFVSGCQALSDEAESILISKCDEIIDYFNEIALYPEYMMGDVIMRWERPINIKVIGEYTEEDYSAITNFIDKLNSIDGVPEISIVDDKSDCYISFETLNDLETNYANFYGFNYTEGDLWMLKIDTCDGEIYNGRIAIANDVTTQRDRNYMILVSITSCLGLQYGSDKYPDSIFFTEWSEAQSLSDMDYEIIRMLYSPSLRAGMNEEQAKEALRPLVKATFTDGSFLE